MTTLKTKTIDDFIAKLHQFHVSIVASLAPELLEQFKNGEYCEASAQEMLNVLSEAVDLAVDKIAKLEEENTKLSIAYGNVCELLEKENG